MPETRARKKTKARKKRVRHRKKYCSICDEIVSMAVVRKAEEENDLYWLVCPECKNRFAYTRSDYRKKKRIKTPAIKRDDAKVYKTNKTFSIGELIYHPKLHDMGLVVEKASAPFAECSGAIIVSFLQSGQKTLIEGYAPS
ncbi:hypothetical protein GF312_03740 [Candidatus Poribacteria bacterium]|nr:hypothetical protein [Candidatus Poribacteria bacterium]